MTCSTRILCFSEPRFCPLVASLGDGFAASPVPATLQSRRSSPEWQWVDRLGKPFEYGFSAKLQKPRNPEHGNIGLLINCNAFTGQEPCKFSVLKQAIKLHCSIIQRWYAFNIRSQICNPNFKISDPKSLRLQT